MKYEVHPFQPWHMRMLADEDAGGFGDIVFDTFSPAVLNTLKAENSWTLTTSFGGIVGCGGTIEQWTNRHIGWVHLSSLSRDCMLRVTRTARTFMAPVKGRIEATVRADFEQGHRWATMLGFEVETPCLKAYGPEGEDHVGYVRIQ